MPSVQPLSKVLVTGASGFIAAWVVKTLLDQGFSVRGTVRSASKGDYLTDLFKDHKDRFEYVVVEDIAKDGCFDEAVKGVDGVAHTASPFHFKAEDPNDLIIPAVKGTVGILESVKKHAPGVKRIVITSSMAAVLQAGGPQKTFTENDWNTQSPKEVEEKGKDALAIHKYRTSKALAERSAWDFVKVNKGEIEFDIVTLNPPLVWGPTLHDVPSASSLNTSLVNLHALIKGEKEPSGEPGGNWVDVRDLAEAHVKALTVEEAGGNRFIIGAGSFATQDLLDAIHAKGDPALASVPKGQPGSGKDAVHPILMDASKSKNVLGLKYKTLEECATDTAKNLLGKGW
ncbi:hypothetical protein M422DRAFT_219369 [Sphaerobolus stellatus SS14]|nr:hypothetical protein M422DRAFT_219369 [Sphaerobolus stellatus SS14]